MRPDLHPNGHSPPVGAPKRRRDDSRGPHDAWSASWGGREYLEVLEGGATMRGGMQRRLNAGTTFTTGYLGT